MFILVSQFKPARESATEGHSVNWTSVMFILVSQFKPARESATEGHSVNWTSV